MNTNYMSNNFRIPLNEKNQYSNKKVGFRDVNLGDYDPSSQVTLESKQCKSPS
jgi:hypothetical protein